MIANMFDKFGVMMHGVFFTVEEPRKVFTIAAGIGVFFLLACLASTTIGTTGASSGVSHGVIGRSDGS